MPQIFKFGGYIIFFWSNENKPTEPIHIHIAKHNPRANSTKIWITKRGKAFVCNNNSQINVNNLIKATTIYSVCHSKIYIIFSSAQDFSVSSL